MSGRREDKKARKKKDKKKKSKTRKRASSSSSKRPAKRAHVDLTAAAPPARRSTKLSRLESVADVPGPADLLDQVFASIGGCTGLGARVEFAWGPDPEHVRGEVKRFVAADKEALAAQDEDDQRRREAGETVARRSKYFDDVMPDPEPDIKYEIVPQQWDPVPRPPDASAAAPAQGPPDVPTLRVFVTHQVIDSIHVSFEARPPMDGREKGTGAFSHLLRVRLQAGGPHAVLEVRYLLHEDLVHNVQMDPYATTEDADVRLNSSSIGSSLDTDTWLRDIPFVLAAKGMEYTPFTKFMHVKVPGDCDAEISEDLLVLKQALRLHDSPDASQHSKWEYRRTEVYATDTFHGAVTAGRVPDDEAKRYQLRWLQLTPFGPSAWRADNARGKEMDKFYLSDSD
jgi:hypothetical protein